MLLIDFVKGITGCRRIKILRRVRVTFVIVFLGSCGRIWMKIGGNQADACPDLPTQPRTLDFPKKIQKSKKNTFEQTRRNISYPNYFSISLTLCKIFVGPPSTQLKSQPSPAQSPAQHLARPQAQHPAQPHAVQHRPTQPSQAHRPAHSPTHRPCKEVNRGG